MRHVGVDGCKAGWLAVSRDDNRLVYRVFATIDELGAGFPSAERILIDVPIGLPSRETPVRPCDRLARAALGAPRQSSVFAPPCREALRALTLTSAREANLGQIERSISAQAWGIAAKIAEVDQYLTNRNGQACLREVHPELCFWALAGKRAMGHAKGTSQGIKERREILERVEPQMKGFLEQILAGTLRREVAADDVLDACVAFVTSEARVGHLMRMAGESASDSNGLPMEMLYLDILNEEQINDDSRPVAELEEARRGEDVPRPVRGVPSVRHHSDYDLPNKDGDMSIREHKVSSRSGRQVMVAGLKLQKDMGYCRGAKVIVSDPAPQSTHTPWQFVVSNDEHATLVSRETPPPDWIQPGVVVRIDVQPPGVPASEPPLRDAPRPQNAPEPRPLSSTELGEMRRKLIRILNKIEGATPASATEGLAARIARLARSERVPREVAPWTRTVTEMRNQTEYQERVLTLIESEAVAAAWRAITAWAEKDGY